MRSLAAAATAAAATTLACATATGGSIILGEERNNNNLALPRRRNNNPFLSSSPAFVVPRGGGSKKQDDESSSSKENSKRKKKKKRRSKDESRKAEEGTSDESAQEQQQHPRTAQEKLVEELLQHEDYYDILGVPKTASEKQIQKAYRRRAVQTHPDKTNGDRRAFDKVAEAYDVLSDDNKRSVYDRFGKRGLDPASGGSAASGFSHSAAEEIFRSFFGGSPFASSFGGGTRAPPPPRNRTMRYQLEVSLEDLYLGLTRKVVITEPSRKTVEVHVPKGMASGQSVLLSGEMDSIPNTTPADLIFMLVQRPHPIFTRKGHDLAMEVKISLQEALCGVTRTIRHLDGRELTISSARSTVGVSLAIHTGDVQVLKGEGMPKPAQHGHEEEEAKDFGDLYVQFLVDMPSSQALSRLTDDERKELEGLLAKLQGTRYADSAKPDSLQNVKHLMTASTGDFGRASGRFQMEQDDIPPEHDGHPRGFPFGGSRQFYWSSSGPGNPFSSGPTDMDDDPNVQCQQM